jgi:hypothetical protein
MVPPLASIGHTSTLQATHCTVYITHCTWKCPYYTLNTVRWTPHIYTAYYKFIKIYMAKCTLIYITFVRCRLEGGPGALGQPALWIGLYPQSHYQSLVTTSKVRILFFVVVANTKHWTFSVCWGTALVRVGEFYISGGINSRTVRNLINTIVNLHIFDSHWHNSHPWNTISIKKKHKSHP